MKKVLSLLGLIAIFSIVSPAYAGGRGEVIHAGPGMHRQMRPHGGWYAPPPPPHKHYRGSAVIGGVLARRSYWGPAYCDYRLGWCDYYTPQYSSNIYIRF